MEIKIQRESSLSKTDEFSLIFGRNDGGATAIIFEPDEISSVIDGLKMSVEFLENIIGKVRTEEPFGSSAHLKEIENV